MSLLRVNNIACAISSTLRGALTPKDVQSRVALRYPEAVPLPEPPELHALLEAQGLSWFEDGGTYGRIGELGLTTMGTRFSPLGRSCSKSRLMSGPSARTRLST